MSDDVKLPVVVVAGLHEEERRRAVDELLAGCVDAVALRHDLSDAALGTVHRELRDAGGAFGRADVPLTNGCPCCALRADLLPQLVRIAAEQQYGLAVVELWGGSDPHPAVEVLAGGEVAGRCMHDVVELAGVVCAVDPLRVTGELSVPDELSEHGLHTSADDARTRAEALAHQVEYATVLAVPGTGPDDDPAARRAGLAMLRQLHPTARTVRLGGGSLIRAALGGFDVAAARDRVNPAIALLPQTHDEAGVATLVWERRRPLHPGRLHDALELLVPAAQRSRGRFWLANRPDLMLAWDAAGANLAVEECGPWLASLPDAAWELYPPERRAAAALDWHPLHGDRVQQLSFTAEGLDADGIVELLDSCLLTDAELMTGEQGWKALPDAFEDLLEPVS
ncbi:GTP-binding protein [Streptomyces sp. CB01881]|uniref:CobW family GTP-binding protein n=1 Tax=Streptomyces sp. CB01881 TaxID=2078691 RepID=UPI000CDCB583|nr:GTP-binding protein [Streptomyces sp. CB01881]AUY52604.1 cobalamin biosynthesis protein CobW [Streptomyces sp. CB01881]TYC70323.1 cobalamin biosynthesis protein CobW [Streptomyces sp. CB01881]